MSIFGSKTHLIPHSLTPQYLAEQSGCPLLDGSKDTFKMKVSHHGLKMKIKFLFICFLFHSKIQCSCRSEVSPFPEGDCKRRANTDKSLFFFKAQKEWFGHNMNFQFKKRRWVLSTSEMRVKDAKLEIHIRKGITHFFPCLFTKREFCCC